LVHVAREAGRVVSGMRRAPKKVLVLDLDNTLWGGVIGDDGIDGIELGDTSPTGEAFKAFQAYVKSLKERGVLLAVASKNDPDKAREAVEQHPEMVLRMDDFVSFKASWDPKSDSLRDMAFSLGLGLDSFVFVDDNPAEIEIVRQFAPEVTTILLGDDPASYVAQLADCRLFEPTTVTSDDARRTDQYAHERSREALRASTTDMDAYLLSLEMEGTIAPFDPADLPRIAQLVNKSNQFNLTTRRRTESELRAIAESNDHAAFSFRLRDRFSDHGLIAVVIGTVAGGKMNIDTWLMSCRVLKRQVEEETMNAIVVIAAARRAGVVPGEYLPTKKNAMVRDLLPRMGFSLVQERDGALEFALEVAGYAPFATRIRMKGLTG
jgi:FkbH-like protein